MFGLKLWNSTWTAHFKKSVNMVFGPKVGNSGQNLPYGQDVVSLQVF